ncbi:MAG: hypothetical protein ABGW87_03400 [Sphingomonadaceae bacterium]
MGARQQLLLVWSVIGATVLTLSGCANAQQDVASHHFEVPKANLIAESDYPFFLPKSGDDGFIFILNPTAELRRQSSVLVQSRDKACARANGRGYVSQTICGSRDVEWRGQHWLKTGDDTFWTYSPSKSSGPAPFVSCFKMEVDGHSGLCYGTFAFGDLVLTISLNDDELPSLEGIYDRATKMLQSWEV